MAPDVLHAQAWDRISTLKPNGISVHRIKKTHGVSSTPVSSLHCFTMCAVLHRYMVKLNVTVVGKQSKASRRKVFTSSSNSGFLGEATVTNG